MFPLVERDQPKGWAAIFQAKLKLEISSICTSKEFIVFGFTNGAIAITHEKNFEALEVTQISKQKI